MVPTPVHRLISSDLRVSLRASCIQATGQMGKIGEMRKMVSDDHELLRLVSAENEIGIEDEKLNSGEFWIFRFLGFTVSERRAFHRLNCV